MNFLLFVIGIILLITVLIDTIETIKLKRLTDKYIEELKKLPKDRGTK